MNTGIPMGDAIWVIIYKITEDHFSSCKPNEEQPHTVLACYNKRKRRTFYTKWLIVDRLTRARLIAL